MITRMQLEARLEQLKNDLTKTQQQANATRQQLEQYTSLCITLDGARQDVEHWLAEDAKDDK